MTRSKPAFCSLWFALMITLVGCATAPPKPGDPKAAWSARQAVLRQHETWALDGKLSVHTDEEGWFAGLSWRQDGERFRIDLKDSLGRIVARIERDGRRVTLIQHDGSKASADTPERLMRELYGWALPVSGLRYWVLGIPGPARAGQRQGRYKLDERGRLAILKQAGWSVDYEAYQDLDPVALPETISVTGHDFRVKLIVDVWDLGRVAAR
jgi:outer membrane lipoprotein LolB